MSLNDVKEILLKASTDSKYRARFFDRKSKSIDEWAAGLGSYDLTEEEKTCLYELTTEDRLADCSEKAFKKGYSLTSDIRI